LDGAQRRGNTLRPERPNQSYHPSHLRDPLLHLTNGLKALKLAAKGTNSAWANAQQSPLKPATLKHLLRDAETLIHDND
jgi:hypothetical protein